MEDRPSEFEFRQLQRELADYKQSWFSAKRRLKGPSFYKQLQQYKDFISVTGSSEFDWLPTRRLPYKLRGYEYADSHGVTRPMVLGSWMSVADIDFDDLPDAFVLKSDGGSTSHGVLPLSRVSRNVFELLDGTRTMSVDEIREHFLTQYKTGSSYGRLFAEELLRARSGADGIPDDIKIYMAYGKVLQVHLRSVDSHGVISETRSKYVNQDGNSLGVVTTSRRVDESIPVPDNLPDMIEIAAHLSRAIGLPFLRVDLFDASSGIVLGEMTRAPGGEQAYLERHDIEMGTEWLLAEARLLGDYRNGRPVGQIWGSEESPELYPRGNPLSRANEARIYLPCAEWCGLSRPASV